MQSIVHIRHCLLQRLYIQYSVIEQNFDVTHSLLCDWSVICYVILILFCDWFVNHTYRSPIGRNTHLRQTDHSEESEYEHRPERRSS